MDEIVRVTKNQITKRENGNRKDATEKNGDGDERKKKGTSK